MRHDLIERLRKFIATKGLMLPASEFEMLALVANELDRIAALEAEASEGERRGLERAAEVTRLATDTHPNACSMLYGAARRTAIAKGYRRGLTYILASEDGASLRAAGWVRMWDVKGRSWDCASRPRTDKHPTEDKVAYGWGAWPHREPDSQRGAK